MEYLEFDLNIEEKLFFKKFIKEFDQCDKGYLNLQEFNAMCKQLFKCDEHNARILYRKMMKKDDKEGKITVYNLASIFPFRDFFNRVMKSLAFAMNDAVSAERETHLIRLKIGKLEDMRMSFSFQIDNQSDYPKQLLIQKGYASKAADKDSVFLSLKLGCKNALEAKAKLDKIFKGLMAMLKLQYTRPHTWQRYLLDSLHYEILSTCEDSIIIRIQNSNNKLLVLYLDYLHVLTRKYGLDILKLTSLMTFCSSCDIHHVYERLIRKQDEEKNRPCCENYLFFAVMESNLSKWLRCLLRNEMMGRGNDGYGNGGGKGYQGMMNKEVDEVGRSKGEKSNNKGKWGKDKDELGKSNGEWGKDKDEKDELGKDTRKKDKAKGELGKDKDELGKTKGELIKDEAKLGKYKDEWDKDKAEWGKDKAEFGKDKGEWTKGKPELGKKKAEPSNNKSVMTNGETGIGKPEPALTRNKVGQVYQSTFYTMMTAFLQKNSKIDIWLDSLEGNWFGNCPQKESIVVEEENEEDDLLGIKIAVEFVKKQLKRLKSCEMPIIQNIYRLFSDYLNLDFDLLFQIPNSFIEINLKLSYLHLLPHSCLKA